MAFDQQVISIMKSIRAFFFPPLLEGASEKNPLVLKVCPNLIQFLDRALLETVEGQLTATLSSAHSLWYAWISLRDEAEGLLHVEDDPSWAHACLQAAKEAIRVLENDEDGRVYCPNYLWAETVCNVHQRVLRQLYKHPKMATLRYSTVSPFESASEVETEAEGCLVSRLKDSVPLALAHFRAAMATNATVTQRLALIQQEYRGPLFAYLDAHEAVLRAPKREWLDGKQAEGDRLAELLKTPALTEALALEQRIEEYERRLWSTYWVPVADVARWWLKRRHESTKWPVPWTTLHEWSTEVKSMRALLLDLESDEKINELLTSIENLTKQSKDHIPQTLYKQASWDAKLFTAQVHDWHMMVERQHVLMAEISDLPTELRREEWLRVSTNSDSNLRERIDALFSDQENRLNVLQRMIQEVCLREMNLHVDLVQFNDDEDMQIAEQGGLFEEARLFISQA